MKKFGMAGMVASALFATVIGLAGPAQADDNGNGSNRHGNDHGYYYDRDFRNNPWIDQLYPSVNVPHVDTSVHN